MVQELLSRGSRSPAEADQSSKAAESCMKSLLDIFWSKAARPKQLKTLRTPHTLASFVFTHQTQANVSRTERTKRSFFPPVIWSGDIIMAVQLKYFINV